MKKYYLITRTLFILSLCGYALSGRGQTQLGENITGAANKDEAGRVSISADGKIVAIGAPFHDETGKENAGHVRIYEYKTNASSGSSGWTQLIGGGDLNGAAAGDQSGYSVSLSADGKTVAIGAPYHDETGKNNAGHVRVYKYNGITWRQLGGDLNGAAADDQSGHSVSLSADGTIVAIGAPYHDETGKSNAGQVRIYKYTPPSSGTGTGTWAQLGADINGAASRDESGYSVSLSADGTIVAIGAPKHDADGTGFSIEKRGQVRIYKYTPPSGTTGTGTWEPLGEEIEGKAPDDWSGWSVSLSADGKTVAIGVPRHNAGGDAPSSVRVYEYKTNASLPSGTHGGSSQWKQAGTDINQGEGTFVLATGEGENKANRFGWSVSLSGNGKTVAIGEPAQGGNPSEDPRKGRTRIYKYNASAANKWEQLGAINGTVANAELGTSVGLSADGTTVATGSRGVTRGTGTPGNVQVYEFFLITSPSTASVPENATTAAYTITSNKVSATFALGTAKDESLFNLVGPELSFKTAPDFENPAGKNKNAATAEAKNVYEVQITATSGGESITKDVTITVTNVVEVPVFSSAATKEVLENRLTTTAVYTAAVSDASTKDAVTFTLAAPSATVTGDEDNTRFTIGETSGKIKFNAIPDYEAPVDANMDNVYNIQITATAGRGTNKQTTTKDVTITVTDIADEAPPSITSGPTASVDENTAGTVTVYTATATDDATAPEAITFSLAAEVKDNDLFEITSAGAVSFKTAPDFENPVDTYADASVNPAIAANDNQYEIQITARDGVGNNSAPQAVTITVTNVVEAPVFTSAAAKEVAENTTGTGATATGYTAAATADASATTGVSFSLVSGLKDNDLFAITSAGLLSFKNAPDYENPAGINKNAATAAEQNVYELQITATATTGTSGTRTSTHDLTITVINVVEVPTFSSEATASTLENATGTVYRAVATPSVSTSTVTFSLKAPSTDASVNADDDNAKFTIDPATGAVKFKTAHVPDFENPGSASGDNVYNIQITATAGGESVTKDVAITVNNMVEAPVFTSVATKEVPENTTGTVYTAATGTDTDAPTFTLRAPSANVATDDDNDKFTIDRTSGAVKFKAAHVPDFENPGSAANSNEYKIQITATAGGDNIIKNVTITVDNVVEAPVFSSAATASVEENTPVATVIYTAAVSDPSKKDAVTFSLAASTTNDNANFTIDGTSGAVKFRTVPDYENPGSAANSNEYKIQITATAGIPLSRPGVTGTAAQAGTYTNAKTATKDVVITVTDVDDTAPVITASNASMAENAKDFAHKATANEAVTFSLVSAIKDNKWFTLKKVSDKETAISFKATAFGDTGPVFANPQDANQDNIYELELQARDVAGNEGKKVLSIEVTDVDEIAPNITSAATASTPENTTNFTYTITANETVTFTLGNAKDEAFFKLEGAKVSFIATPDYENPKDADKDNVYKLELKATDVAGNEGKKVLSITVTDVVEPGIISLPETLTFADTKVGETASKVLTIKNTGNDAVLKVTAITYPTGFTGDWPSGIIAAGGEQVVNVSFKPTEAKAYTGTITIASDAANATEGKNTLSVSGKGILVTGIEPQSIFPGLSVFPNPVEDVLHVKLPNQTRPLALQLIDVNGQVVYEQDAVTSDELSLDVSGYRSGVYVLVLSSGSKVVQRKVVID